MNKHAGNQEAVIGNRRCLNFRFWRWRKCKVSETYKDLRMHAGLGGWEMNKKRLLSQGGNYYKLSLDEQPACVRINRSVQTQRRQSQ